jgi:hypothetical protein
MYRGQDPKIYGTVRDDGMAQVVQHKCEGLSLNPSAVKKKM